MNDNENSINYIIKIVDFAVIEVKKFSELQVGDEILWSNWKRKITKIDKYNREIHVTNPLDENIETLKAFMNYYVIRYCKEKEEELI